jgi:hypothetical protein
VSIAPSVPTIAEVCMLPLIQRSPIAGVFGYKFGYSVATTLLLRVAGWSSLPAA